MKVFIFRTRMAMPEPAYAYDALVPTTDVDRSKHHYFVVRDGKEFVSFADATRPPELDAMELGWERYQASLAHEERAKEEALVAAKRLFPELKPATKWPLLWVVIPNLDEPHARKSYVRGAV